MGLTNTPAAERVHIAFFGCTNAGKSSVINAVTAQNLSIVSDVKGTTTDPVRKTMEILPIGPVVITDTPGIDDVSVLGKQRVERAFSVLDKTDIAVLVVDSEQGINTFDTELVELIKSKNLPYIICYNKCDVKRIDLFEKNEISVSAKTGEGINELKELIAGIVKAQPENVILSDLIAKGDIVVLVIPIDSSAPKGRLILPQQQTMRELLENGNPCIAVQPNKLADVIKLLGDKIKLVVTDSQAFAEVAKIVPENMPLTSFSILFLRYKGELEPALCGVKALENIKDGDKILISEGCTHHRQCEDIGTVKIPKLVRKYTGKNIDFEFTSGTDFKRELSEYALVIHCGGCMLNAREMQSRMGYAKEQGIPITNYGTTIAYITGILERATKPLSTSKRQ